MPDGSKGSEDSPNETKVKALAQDLAIKALLHGRSPDESKALLGELRSIVSAVEKHAIEGIKVEILWWLKRIGVGASAIIGTVLVWYFTTADAAVKKMASDKLAADTDLRSEVIDAAKDRVKKIVDEKTHVQTIVADAERLQIAISSLKTQIPIEAQRVTDQVESFNRTAAVAQRSLDSEVEKVRKEIKLSVTDLVAPIERIQKMLGRLDAAIEKAAPMEKGPGQ